MPSPETNPKPPDKPPEQEGRATEEKDKSVDRDGRDRQPIHHTDEK